jgi:hypothetical protein
VDGETATLSEEPQHKNHSVYFVPGLQRGLGVLEAVAVARRPLNITEIAAELGLTRSALAQHRLSLPCLQRHHRDCAPRIGSTA